MPSHHFTLIVEGADLQGADTLDALFEAGCDDALVGRSGTVQYIDFDREADQLDQAIFSAVANVETVPALHVERIADAGLASIAAIARRTGRTRESVRLLIAGDRGPGGFPPPVTDPRSRYRLWRWSEVEQWFADVLGEQPDGGDASIVAAINASLDLRRHSGSLPPEGRKSLWSLARAGQKAAARA